MPSSTLYTAAQYAALLNKQVGKKYVLGEPRPYKGGNPKAFDCSGLIVWANNESGAHPMGDDTAEGLFNRSKPVTGSPKVGDMVFLANNSKRKAPKGFSMGIGHMAVLTSKLSNGDWRIIEARGKASGVVATTLGYWKTRPYYAGIRRLPNFKLAPTPKPKSEPIVIVAGSANTTTGKLHAKYKRRLDVVLSLLNKDKTLRVIVTGGVKSGVAEATNAKAYLVSQGIAPSRVLEENKSGSTHSNFTRGLPIAKEAGATSLIVVSDFSHMRRCLAFAYAADKAKKTGIPISGVAWYKDGTKQDATVAQATEQAKAAWSGMTQEIVKSLDSKWGIVSGPVIPPTIRRGSKGANVRKLQQELNKNGAKLVVDDDFGAKTEAAVKAYQKSKKLTADGIVGPKTWALLLA